MSDIKTGEVEREDNPIHPFVHKQQGRGTDGSYLYWPVNTLTFYHFELFGDRVTRSEWWKKRSNCSNQDEWICFTLIGPKTPNCFCHWSWSNPDSLICSVLYDWAIGEYFWTHSARERIEVLSNSLFKVKLKVSVDKYDWCFNPWFNSFFYHVKHTQHTVWSSVWRALCLWGKWTAMSGNLYIWKDATVSRYRDKSKYMLKSSQLVWRQGFLLDRKSWLGGKEGFFQENRTKGN